MRCVHGSEYSLAGCSRLLASVLRCALILHAYRLRYIGIFWAGGVRLCFRLSVRRTSASALASVARASPEWAANHCIRESAVCQKAATIHVSGMGSDGKDAVAGEPAAEKLPGIPSHARQRSKPPSRLHSGVIDPPETENSAAVFICATKAPFMQILACASGVLVPYLFQYIPLTSWANKRDAQKWGFLQQTFGQLV